MIFNMTGGGGIAGSGSGAGLNFKVVGGTTQPSNPSENTIWVNTDSEITGWMFSAESPFIGEIVEDAKTVLGTVNTSSLTDTSRTLKKKNDGKAVVALYSDSSSIGAIMVSPDREACTVLSVPVIATTDATPVTTEANGSFVHNGETYYYAYVSFNDFIYSFGSDEEPISCNSIAELAKALAPLYNGDGNVWIRTDTHSNVEFNALKKNGITVYPISAKQYIDGAWAGKTAQSFQNGEWVEWLPEGALYWHGNECVDITGGWACKAWKMSSNAATGSQTFEIARNNDNLTFTKTGQTGAVMHTANMIDLTNVNTIHFKGEMCPSANGNGLWAGFYVWSNMDGKYWDSNAAAREICDGNTTKTEFTLDVSALDGAYYIGFGIYDVGCYVVLEGLYMEVA